MIIRNFVVFEGIDGAGTTTQAAMLQERLGAAVAVSAEPTNGEVGRFLRRILRGDLAVDKAALPHLFAADRAEHLYGAGGIMETVQRTGERGKIIAISDRYLFSSLVYQGQDAAVPNSTFPLPELLFYFRINGEEAYRRVASRDTSHDIYEKRNFLITASARYDEVIAAYNGTALGEGMKVVILDATRSREDICDKIYQTVTEVAHTPL